MIRKIIFKNIVPQYHCHVALINKRFSLNKSVRQSPRNFLDLEIEMDPVIFKN